MNKIFGFAAIFIFSLATIASAHPPQLMTLDFDKPTQTLTATIIHQVNNPYHHYIFKIVVSVNGKEIVDKKLDHQDDREQEKIQFVLKDVNPGDTITVEAFCNISGHISSAFKVE